MAALLVTLFDLILLYSLELICPQIKQKINKQTSQQKQKVTPSDLEFVIRATTKISENKKPRNRIPK